MRRRIWATGMIFLLALSCYAALRKYSPALVAFVVEETLVRKAPDNADPGRVRSRFQRLISGCPDDAARLRMLLAVSQSLEKVQKLSELQLEQLLDKETEPPR